MYPDSDQGFANPVSNGTVYVEVRRRYHRGWYKFFDSRSEGSITYRPDDELVRVDLTVPMREGFDNVLATTDGTITANPGPGPEPYEEGGNYPSADGTIEDWIERCEENDDECTPLPTTGGTLAAGTYYADSHVHSGSFEVDPNGNEVDVIINGDLLMDSLTIEGDGRVNVFVRNNLQVGGAVNEGGEARDFVAYVHSDGNVDMNGNFHVTGGIYAPGSHANLNGGDGPSLNLKGGIIANGINVNGKPNEFEYDPSIADVELALTDDADLNPIVYLHVTDTEIESGWIERNSEDLLAYRHPESDDGHGNPICLVGEFDGSVPRIDRADPGVLEPLEIPLPGVISGGRDRNGYSTPVLDRAGSVRSRTPRGSALDGSPHERRPLATDARSAGWFRRSKQEKVRSS